MSDGETQTQQNYQIRRGAPMPLGATISRDGINFAIYSRQAESVTLVLFAKTGHEIAQEIRLNPRINRTGNVWHVFLKKLEPGVRYGYRVEQPSVEGDPARNARSSILLMDPYAKVFSGVSSWGTPPERFDVSRAGNGCISSLIIDDEFDWGDDQPLTTPLADTVIYELHLRGYTRDPSSGVTHPGTFLGLMEKIPYLKDLGVTAVELLPINEFDEIENKRVNPDSGKPLLNYWGYSSIGFFAPKASYAFQSQNGGQAREFKLLVKSLHKAGIEVILDMVFNHTAEGNELGPTYSFKGLDNSTYYMLEPGTGAYRNYSGCGNTMNCNHPVVRDMILDTLRYWVTEMHVDGFRFDLASILGRGQNGEELANPPVLERIAHDPVLANTKLIAEAWDAAGLYQVGSFPAWGRWAEMNGKFRDDVRRFIKGDPGMVPALASRLLGSPDLYQHSGRAPYHSINFITCHDGFTLNDLVSYNEKHNLLNGENNADGSCENLSWNCGAEGATDSVEINRLRSRQIKNFATLLLLSHGVPFMCAGDEFGRTQLGNNNAYCQDNEISWVNWQQRETHAGLFRFFRQLIQFRKSARLLRPQEFAGSGKGRHPKVAWHGVRIGQPDWSHESRTLAMHVSDVSFHRKGEFSDVYLIANAHWEEHLFELPSPWAGVSWLRKVDTSDDSPQDIYERGKEIMVTNQRAYHARPRSIVVLVALAPI